MNAVSEVDDGEHQDLSFPTYLTLDSRRFRV
jgi:hypothetical protein